VAIFKETVPKFIYDQKCREYDDLLAKYHALRQSGYDPASKLRIIAPKPDSGLAAMQAGERAFTDPRLARAFAECVASGMSEPDALREATRLVAIATGKAEPTSAGASLPDLAAGVP
jgi:hypothetical protein